jgi:hypothetical protein
MWQDRFLNFLVRAEAVLWVLERVAVEFVGNLRTLLHP